MKIKRRPRRPEQIVKLLQEGEAILSADRPLGEVLQKLEVKVSTIVWSQHQGSLPRNISVYPWSGQRAQVCCLQKFAFAVFLDFLRNTFWSGASMYLVHSEPETSLCFRDLEPLLMSTSDFQPNGSTTTDGAEGIRRLTDYLVDQHQPLVSSVSLKFRLNWHTSEDVFQQASLKAYAAIDQVEDIAKIKPWFRAILHKEGLQNFRSWKAQRRAFREYTKRCLDQLHQLQEEPDAQTELAEDVAWMRDQVRSLPDKDRWLLERRFFDGCTYPAIADETGRTDLALRQQVHRILMRLRDEWEGRLRRQDD